MPILVLLLSACSLAGQWEAEAGPGPDTGPDDGEDSAGTALPPRHPGVGDVVIAEIMKNPDPTDDDTGEWFELRNVSGGPLDLSGVLVRDDDGESFPLGGTLAAGDWLVAGASADPEANGGFLPTFVWPEGSFHFSNDSDELVLQQDGVEVDAVRYDGHFPDDPGRSASLDPGALTGGGNDDPDAWCNADSYYGTDGDRGTPGGENDHCG